MFSGGTEGVLSPHVTIIVEEDDVTGLLACTGRTRNLEPHEIGTAEHAKQVARAVDEIISRARIAKEHVHLVLIKCPLLTSAKIEAIKVSSRTPVTTDTYESMARSRYASAVGIGAALGEINEGEMEEAMRKENKWSSKASCSSGAELEDCHILVLASYPE